nr:RNA-directed DNA polymerase, eukaryota [Tanacetum cinerariifolium]
MVLDESCLNNDEFSLCLLGKVTEFASLTNLKVVLSKEGFGNIELKYMGGFWVMIVFQEEETMKAFYGNKSVGSWFSQIVQAHKEFMIEERVIWVEIEGDDCDDDDFESNDGTQVVEGPGENVEKCSDLEGESDSESIPETRFEDEPMDKFDDINSIPHSKPQSEDLFGVYELLNKKKKVTNNEEDSWNEIHVVDNNAYVRFMKKLKLLKERIKAWNSSYRELTNCNKNTLKTELTNLDSVLDRGEGIDTDVTRRSDVVCILQDIKKTEAMEVAQKAKIKWVVEGDENSKYYHGVINKKRNNLAIRGVLVDVNWVESSQLVRNEFYAHFKQRFEKPNLSGIQFDREFPNKICSEQAVDLEREVSKEEVKRAVWDCGVDKAPCPDGFTFGFYRGFWNLIECDVVKAVKWWDFVDTILKKFGFGDKWRKWIHSCLQSSRGSILINGSPTLEFQFFKGLKQGDPLSPFLFILLMESLHLSFQRVVDVGLFSGIKLDSSMSVSHLFYADDAIFIGQWNQSNIDTIVRVLKVFHSASGLRINMKKSKLMGIAVDAFRVELAIQ